MYHSVRLHLHLETFPFENYCDKPSSLQRLVQQDSDFQFGVCKQGLQKGKDKRAPLKTILKVFLKAHSLYDNINFVFFSSRHNFDSPTTLR